MPTHIEKPLKNLTKGAYCNFNFYVLAFNRDTKAVVSQNEDLTLKEAIEQFNDIAADKNTDVLLGTSYFDGVDEHGEPLPYMMGGRGDVDLIGKDKDGIRMFYENIEKSPTASKEALLAMNTMSVLKNRCYKQKPFNLILKNATEIIQNEAEHQAMFRPIDSKIQSVCNQCKREGPQL